MSMMIKRWVESGTVGLVVMVVLFPPVAITVPELPRRPVNKLNPLQLPLLWGVISAVCRLYWSASL